jgi:membrane-associated phospholipid phosphatase
MRVSEWAVAAFFLWTSVLAVVLPVPAEMRTRALAANACVGLALFLMWRFGRLPWVGVVRDWVPQAMMILAYKQMGWFAPPSHTYELEKQWIVWDWWLLNEVGLRTVVEWLGPVLPSLLEISYSFVYAVPPITMGVLYAYRMQRRSDMLLTIYLLGLFLVYAQFPFWPSEPPRTVFAGQDLPRFHTVFRDFNLWLVGGYGIHTSVFPSAHVSGVFAAALAMTYLLPHRRLLLTVYWTYACLVAVATIYGRYHYAVDAAAGVVVALAAYGIARPLERRFMKKA